MAAVERDDESNSIKQFCKLFQDVMQNKISHFGKQLVASFQILATFDHFSEQLNLLAQSIQA